MNAKKFLRYVIIISSMLLLFNVCWADKQINVRIDNQTDIPLAIGFNIAGDGITEIIAPQSSIKKEGLNLNNLEDGDKRLSQVHRLTLYKHAIGNHGEGQMGVFLLNMSCNNDTAFMGLDEWCTSGVDVYISRNDKSWPIVAEIDKLSDNTAVVTLKNQQ